MRLPVTVGWAKLFRMAVDEIFGTARVRMTPALVPTHKRSLQASTVVMRRHAVLCCRMMSSAADKHTHIDIAITSEQIMPIFSSYSCTVD